MMMFPSTLYARQGPSTVTTNWRFPTVANQVVSSAPVWLSPNNVMAAADAYASTTLTDSGQTSRSLRVAGFGFSAESIPAGATIISLEVEIQRNKYDPGGEPTSDSVIERNSLNWQDDYLSPSVIGVGRSNTDDWANVDETVTFTWSIPAHGALTKAILEGANFAILLTGKRASGVYPSVVLRIDYIKARATYYY